MPFSENALCNVIKPLREYEQAAQSLKLSMDKPSDLQKTGDFLASFWATLGWAVFNEFEYFKPALLRCVQYIYNVSGKSSGSSEIDKYIAQYAVKVDPQKLAISSVQFHTLRTLLELRLPSRFNSERTKLIQACHQP